MRIEEIRDWLADFENRISFIENSLPYHREELVPVYQDMEWTNRQWDAFNQLKAEVVGWREKHAKALLEIDKLKAKVERGSKETFTIL